MKRVKKLPRKTFTRAEVEADHNAIVDHAANVGPVDVVNDDGTFAYSISIKCPPIIDMCMQCYKLHPQYCPNTGKYEYEDWEDYIEDDDD